MSDNRILGNISLRKRDKKCKKTYLVGGNASKLFASNGGSPEVIDGLAEELDDAVIVGRSVITVFSIQTWALALKTEIDENEKLSENNDLQKAACR